MRQRNKWLALVLAALLVLAVMPAAGLAEPEPCQHEWEITSDENIHWIQCKHCDATKSDFGFSHGSCDPDATECPICGRDRNECEIWSDDHAEDLNGDLIVTETGCGYACAVCGEEVLYAHMADCQTPTVCRLCGKSVEDDSIVIGEISHDADWTDTKSDDYKHWLLCENCSEPCFVEYHEDLDEDGFCDECEHAIVPCTGHQWVVESDEWGHWRRCSVCGEMEGGVSYDHGSCDPDATECAVCGRDREACGYWFEDHVENITASLISETDGCGYPCAECGEAILHDHVADCTAPTVCKTCGKSVSEDGIVIGLVEHDPDWEDYETTDYKHWMLCKRCHEPCYEDRHYDYDEDGFCDACGHAIVACPGHLWVVESDEWQHWRQCSVCGEIETDLSYDHGSCDPDATECAVCGRAKEDCSFWWDGHVEDLAESRITAKDGCGYPCAECGEAILSDHVADCTAPEICLNCGKSVSEDGIVIGLVEHDPDWEHYESSDYKHWTLCEECHEPCYEDRHYDYDEDGFCDACEHVIVPCPGHEWVIESDDSLHWRCCAVCGENELAYYIHGSCDPEATECAVCGRPRAECDLWLTNHAKDITGEMISTETECGYPCAECGNAVLRKHEAYCDEPDVCLNCGKSASKDGITIGRLVHMANWESYESDEYRHWQICTDCGEACYAVAHRDEDKDGICDVCDHTITPCPGHQWELYETDLTGAHYYQCTVCGDTRAEAHADQNGDGLCDVCGYALGDSHVSTAHGAATQAVITGDAESILAAVRKDGKVPANVTETTPGALKAALDRGETVTPTVVARIKRSTELSADQTRQMDEIGKTLNAKKMEVALVMDLGVNLVGEEGETLARVTELSQPIEFSVTLTEEQAKALAGKEIAVLRVHDGKMGVIPATLKGTTLTFRTDKFSKYIVAGYEPKPGTQDDVPETGDTAGRTLWPEALLLAALGAACVLTQRHGIREK